MKQHIQDAGHRRGAARTWLRATLVAAVAVAALGLGAAPAQARGPAVGGKVAAGSLPREARRTYDLIFTGGPFPYAKDGVTFGNYEGALPQRRRGYYHEYTVPTPGARNRGARRIVCGGEKADWARNRPAACYYTDNHYASFREIRD
ncbi:MAG TPA: ribonuclease domain-containing protein [Burkholderiales bacterium]